MKVKITSSFSVFSSRAEWSPAGEGRLARAFVCVLMFTASAAAALLPACGAEEDGSLPVCEAALCTEEQEEARVTVVYAPESDRPVFFSFAAPASAVGAEAAAAGAWDLSFARTTIRVNGGSSGEGEVEVVWRDGVSLADEQEAPAEGWVSDGADDKSLAFAADDGWYKYDLLKHEVQPRPRVYYVRARDGLVYALEMISYYSHAGEARYPTLRWRAAAPPGG